MNSISENQHRAHALVATSTYGSMASDAAWTEGQICKAFLDPVIELSITADLCDRFGIGEPIRSELIAFSESYKDAISFGPGNGFDLNTPHEGRGVYPYRVNGGAIYVKGTGMPELAARTVEEAPLDATLAQRAPGFSFDSEWLFFNESREKPRINGALSSFGAKLEFVVAFARMAQVIKLHSIQSLHALMATGTAIPIAAGFDPEVSAGIQRSIAKSLGGESEKIAAKSREGYGSVAIWMSGERRAGRTHFSLSRVLRPSKVLEKMYAVGIAFAWDLRHGWVLGPGSGSHQQNIVQSTLAGVKGRTVDYSDQVPIHATSKRLLRAFFDEKVLLKWTDEVDATTRRVLVACSVFDVLKEVESFECELTTRETLLLRKAAWVGFINGILNLPVDHAVGHVLFTVGNGTFTTPSTVRNLLFRLVTYLDEQGKIGQFSHEDERVIHDEIARQSPNDSSTYDEILEYFAAVEPKFKKLFSEQINKKNISLRQEEAVFVGLIEAVIAEDAVRSAKILPSDVCPVVQHYTYDRLKATTVKFIAEDSPHAILPELFIAQSISQMTLAGALQSCQSDAVDRVMNSLCLTENASSYKSARAPYRRADSIFQEWTDVVSERYSAPIREWITRDLQSAALDRDLFRIQAVAITLRNMVADCFFDSPAYEQLFERLTIEQQSQGDIPYEPYAPPTLWQINQIPDQSFLGLLREYYRRRLLIHADEPVSPQCQSMDFTPSVGAITEIFFGFLSYQPDCLQGLFPAYFSAELSERIQLLAPQSCKNALKSAIKRDPVLFNALKEFRDQELKPLSERIQAGETLLTIAPKNTEFSIARIPKGSNDWELWNYHFKIPEQKNGNFKALFGSIEINTIDDYWAAKRVILINWRTLQQNTKPVAKKHTNVQACNRSEGLTALACYLKILSQNIDQFEHQ